MATSAPMKDIYVAVPVEFRESMSDAPQESCGCLHPLYACCYICFNAGNLNTPDVVVVVQHIYAFEIKPSNKI